MVVAMVALKVVLKADSSVAWLETVLVVQMVALLV